MAEAEGTSQNARGLTLLVRALLLRCPVCGHSGLFENWFKIKDRCPTCGFVFGRGESGYQLGSMAIDLVVPLVVWFVGFFAILMLTWPKPPWTLLQWGSAVFMIAFPIVLYPVSHTLAIALDVLVRPPGRE